MTGAVGSLFFVVAAACEGEHNDWRRFSWSRVGELPVWCSILTFLGATLAPPPPPSSLHTTLQPRHPSHLLILSSSHPLILPPYHPLILSTSI
jgi:hypothetical protein